jgi:Tol biopolymer transport system component
VRNPQLSPDGEWLTFWEAGKQEDIFVIKTDGTGLRQLTNDVYKDRYPEWSPDGRRIAFHSNRAGKHDIWLINPDGSALERLTYAPAPAVYRPVWSPDGKRLIYSIPSVRSSFVMEVAKPWKEQSPQPVAVPREIGGWFYATSWSADGRKLSGRLWKGETTTNSIVVYSLESGKVELLTHSGTDPVWLGDSRRLLLSHQGKLYVVDSQTGKAREILSVAPYDMDSPALSQDDRLMYFSLVVKEADIWLATIE